MALTPPLLFCASAFPCVVLSPPPLHSFTAQATFAETEKSNSESARSAADAAKQTMEVVDASIGPEVALAADIDAFLSKSRTVAGGAVVTEADAAKLVAQMQQAQKDARAAWAQAKKDKEAAEKARADKERADADALANELHGKEHEGQATVAAQQESVKLVRVACFAH